jgi:Beta-propeller repeat
MARDRSRRRNGSIIVAALLCGVLSAPLTVDGARRRTVPSNPVPRTPGKTADMLRGLSLVFEPNLGQTDPQVRFLARASGMMAFLTDRQNVMVLSRSNNKPDSKDPRETPDIERTVVRMKREGARAPRSFYEGADSLTTYQEGNLLTSTRLGTLVQRKPLVYPRESTEEHREVRASRSIRTENVEFGLANGERKRDLVIDAVLEYATYLGGSATDRAYRIAVDKTRAAYRTGNTSSINFPTTTGAYQTGESKSEIPAADGKIGAWTIPPSAQLDARNSRENLCNGF